MKGFWIGVVLVAGLIALLVWLDPEPTPFLRDCIKSHMTMTLLPVSDAKGHVTLRQHWHSVCDEYGPPYRNPAHIRWEQRQREKNGRSPTVENAETVASSGSLF